MSSVKHSVERRSYSALVASEADLAFAERAQELRLAQSAPLIGDYVKFSDNSLRRLSVSYGDWG